MRQVPQCLQGNSQIFKFFSLSAYHSRLKKHFSPYQQIKMIRNEDAQSFINNLKIEETNETVSDSTKSRHLTQSKRIFNVAKEWGYIRKNPFEGIRIGKIRKQNWHIITIEEFSLILNAVDKYVRVTKKDINAYNLRILRLKTFYSLMYYCGLRFGEAANLLWDSNNIDFVNNQINLCNRPAQPDLPPFDLKDYESRSVPIPEKVMTILLELQEKSEQGNPFVFLSKKSYERVVVSWKTHQKEGREDWNSKKLITDARRDFKCFCQKAGIKTNDKINIHSLRKAYGTNLANLGIPPHTLKDLMGHSKVTTTMEYYVKTVDENKRAAAEKLNQIAIV